ncbi:flagellar hook capping FlgD N-terminal domain-containing protein [Paracoccus seriniphilus]|uniref:Basal-body rod modification protein FlgD n=1 Tax=Paracoccus seriniphilus TaxID=184748 RepID=A0A239PL01_9RHOB|nr:flagellar hook capping FlgD N-terminal domain-containing protein [Paracoccus seriniphilus]WCR13886.1 flagellar basal body rod modification protein [Paracoccus seriniphilus]SNT68491.1 flagellar basal-body rod modification protein FlgD [Paracoccus seriniphilus]
MIQATGATSITATTAATTSTSATSTADFDTFLQMLTAQLKNQDPLNPMEGTEFAVQLATFSGVEQQTRTNQLLEEMLAHTSGDLGQMAQWIGKQARTTQPVWFGDSSLTLEVTPDPSADSVLLVTRNAAGTEISREEIGPGSGQIEWFGRDGKGDRLPKGQYSFETISIRNDEVIGIDPASAYGRVVEAQLGPQGTEVILEGGSVVLADEVTALREMD